MSHTTQVNGHFAQYSHQWTGAVLHVFFRTSASQNREDCQTELFLLNAPYQHAVGGTSSNFLRLTGEHAHRNCGV